MHRRLLLGLLLATLCHAQQEPPHVVLVLADDLGIGDLGCYNPQSKIPTPNLDRIARDGMRFTDMHSPAAVCTPTRYGLLTGRYAWRTRLKRGVLDGSSPALIEPGRPTIASVLGRRGYATAGIGKWHLGLGGGQRTDWGAPLTPGPRDAGFDWYYGIPASLDMPPYLYFENTAVVEAAVGRIGRSEPRRRNGGGFWRAGAIAPGFHHAGVLDVLTAKAAGWIDRRARDGRKPFFLYVPLSAPHTPWLPSAAFRGRSGAGDYGDFVAMVDAAVGRIAAALDRTGLAERTLLVVTSDNGAHWPAADIERWGHRANLGYRGQKADIWEGGHRVPFLARWPGRIAPGSTSAETACLTDLVATLAHAAGADLPDEAGPDSFDFLPVLLGEDRGGPVREATVYHSAAGMFAIRQGKWKLILGRGSGGFTSPRRIRPADLGPGAPRGQLYDLVHDPGERTNLWKDRPDLVTRLAALLAKYRHDGRSTPRRAGPATPRPNTSGGPLLPVQARFDVEHYDLRLRVDPARRRIEGSLTMRARVVEKTQRLVLQLDDRLEVQAVRAGGRRLDATRGRGRIDIVLPDPVPEGGEVEVTVDYAGSPRPAPQPPWRGGFTWSRSQDGRPWIATSCQAEGADLWWPCKDHPSDKAETMDLRITVPGDLVCASNGVLVSDRRNPDGTRSFHWHVANPISNYCVALAIGPYEVLHATYRSVTGDKVPAFFWVLPENLDRARAALPEFLGHLRFLEEVCGPYPFRNEKYGVVETPHLGMEHQTIIAYGNRYRKRSFDFDWLHLHELSHEWWGNLVTCRDWKDMWVHEGFATYMEALWIERHRGAKAYRTEMGRKRARLVNRRPVAPRFTVDSLGIYFGSGGGFDNDIYYKGSWILHTLRWLVGDKTFFRALRRMCYPTAALERTTDGSQVHFADTEDFRRLVEKLSQRDLGWFFAVYLRQPALPVLHVEHAEAGLRLRWEAPRGLPFPMPVPVRVGGRILRITMPGGAGSLDLPPGTEAVVDPEARILKARR